MTGMTITHQDQGDHGRYVAELEGEQATGHLDWERRGEDVRVATHTIVPSEIGGQGVAARLVDALVADAREDGFKVDPRCSYVAKKFDEHPDWSDLRA
ncbi:GNAT family N-acetyltransferase [Qipengyuania sp.]|uniref:GNAT family N-acetyltransferase n=1 Tax=Qipengyuania sp. TaxID=2004515 RepID=UPI0035C80BF4